MDKQLKTYIYIYIVINGGIVCLWFRHNIVEKTKKESPNFRSCLPVIVGFTPDDDIEFRGVEWER